MRSFFLNLIPPAVGVVCISLIFDLVMLVRILYYQVNYDFRILLPGRGFSIFFPILLFVCFVLQFIIIQFINRVRKLFSLLVVGTTAGLLFLFVKSESAGIALSFFVAVLYLLYLSINIYIYKKLNLCQNCASVKE